jgi:uncharacterized protein (DUF302 family)
MSANKEYAFRTTLELPHAKALDRVIAALKEEGFGVLTSVDVKQTFKERLGVDFRDYTIIGACSPPLSNKALNADLEAGLVLPCNVIVYERDGKSAVAIADPVVMIGTLQNPALDPVAREARERLQRVISRLS